jgi:hypothetical protein
MVTKEEINKYLTEAMGECWHECGEVLGDSLHIPMTIKCIKCGTLMILENSCEQVLNNDFFTWEGFGKLKEFMVSYHPLWMVEQMTLFLTDPERFATEVYEFLIEENDNDM